MPDVTPSLSTGLQFPNSVLESDQSGNSQELPPFNSLVSDVRPLLSRHNQLKLKPDHSVVGRQLRREYYTNHARRMNDPVLINLYNNVSNQSSANGKNSFGIGNLKNILFKAHLSPLNDW